MSPQSGGGSGEQRFATQDRRRPRDASSDLSQRSRLSEQRSRERFVTSARYSDSRRFGSKDSPSPRRVGFASRGSPSPKRMGFASRGSPSPKRMGFTSRGSPSPKRMGFASRGSPSPKRMGFASRGSPSPKRKGFASRDSPSPKRRRFASGDSVSPRRQHSSRASSGDGSFERPPSRSSPTRPSSPSREDKEADESSIPAPVRAMIDFILKSFPDAQALPSHLSSRSFDLSAYAGVTDAAIPPGSLLAWCHALSDAFSDTHRDSLIASRMGRSAILCCLLSTSSRECPQTFMRERGYPRLCPRSQDHEGISFSLPGMGHHSLLQ